MNKDFDMQTDKQNTEIKREIRRQRALDRLGSNTPRCMHCGECNPHCLEAHHIAGCAYDDETVIVCRNCHRKLSDKQKDHPGPASIPPDPLDRMGHFLLGLADLFRMLVGRLEEFGRDLIARAAKMAAQNTEAGR
ncbi:MAG: hypothetical protein K2P80_08130 [Beijerinckiaceae bacterium]|nr:hypothetical protein [Beijerinckiaceae bacterium]